MIKNKPLINIKRKNNIINNSLEDSFTISEALHKKYNLFRIIFGLK